MNRSHFSLSLFATTALSAGLGLAVPVPALAQEEEIIVTARRVEERLQDVPASIAVFNQQQLDSRNITSGQDLALYTPNLSVSSQFGSNNAAFAIRGFVQEAHTTASVGTYFAEVVAPRGGNTVLGGGNEGASAGNLWDLQNVQVLRGPQGTLFGRNTTGGAVLLVPQKPTSRFGGYIEGSYGNFDMKRLQGVINIPINDKIRFRAGFDRMTRDGYVNNYGDVGPRHLGSVDRISGRASLVVDITPEIENYTLVTLTNSDGTLTQPSLYAANPANTFPQVVASLDKLKAANDPLGTINPFPKPRDWLQAWQAINTTTWHATDLLTVKNIASYSVIRQDTFYNVLGAETLIYAAAPLRNYHSIDQYNLTEELQLQGRSANNRLNWQFGVYYEQSNPHGDS
jgi:iron complex outermembrane receptor protein